MNPFANLVGLRSVTNSQVNPRMWVNDIPGIQTELVADLVSSSPIYGPDETVLEMWEKVQREALTKLTDEVLIEVSSKGDFQPVLSRLDDVASPSFSATLPINSANAFTGVRIELPYVAATRLDLEAVSLCVATLAGNGIHQLQVRDVNSGNRLFDQAVTLTAGVNTIPLSISVQASLLMPIRILVLLTNVADTLLVIPPPQWEGDTVGMVCESVQAQQWEGLLVNPVTPAPAGLTVAASWTRSIDSRLVRYTSDLLSPYRLLCGSLLLTEKMATPNLSVFTLSNRAFSDRQEDKLYAEAKRLIKVVARRVVQDWASETVAPTLTERTDLNRIEEGSYV